MQADPKQVRKLVQTARGQVEAVSKMIDEDRYCIDIINQILAAESLLRKARMCVLEGHIQGCVASAIQAGDEQEREQKLREMVELLGRMNK
ncbi:MAG: metal-sensing transcriptional repressor [Butyricicoccus sp.]|nr:metal-sensing transcriptional repressor [Butyricicoccus sp.]